MKNIFKNFSSLPAIIWRYIKTHKVMTAMVIIGLLVVVGIARARAPKPVTYNFVQPEVRNLTKTLDASGVVDAKEKVRMRFLAGGKLTYLGVKEGDAVKKWQTLARIDQATLDKQLQKDLNTYLKERYDWEDTRDDIKDRSLNTTQVRQVDRNQLDLNNTVLDVEIRDIAIQNTLLTAPFAGIITAAPTTSPGVQLLSSDYFELVNPQTLLFRAEVDEADIGLLTNGQEAAVSLDAFPNRSFSTAISYISYTSSQTTGGTVFLVELPLTQEMGAYIATQSASDSAGLRIGMNGEATITLATKNDVLSIPVDCIRERENKTYVDVKTGDQTVEEREITKGLETDDYVEVVSGLSTSDQVVLPE